MEMTLLSVYVETHGCKLNQADSQSIKNSFKKSGYLLSDNPKTSDIYILNTCTVTSEADRKARQALRSIRRANTDSFIVVTGCYAERDPESLGNLDEVDLILGNQNKLELVNTVTNRLGKLKYDYLETQPHEIFPELKTRAMVKIQEGCDQICSYCIVPKVRGREKSIPSHIIVNQILDLEKEGFNEVVLTGTQLISYGFEYGHTNLRQLLETILLKTNIPRIRVSSLQPQIIDRQFLNLWKSERLCPHFHIPLQSGSDSVLQKMRRLYDTSEYAEKIALVRSELPEASVTTDIIAGFPGESDLDFEKTYELCDKLRFSDMHIFPYSARAGTSAWYFKPKVEPIIKKHRVDALIKLSTKNSKAYRESLLGQTRKVLWEKKIRLGQSNYWSGLTDNYARVYTQTTKDQSNEIRSTVLTSISGDRLFGKLVVNSSKISH
jgi:threonylcarbamoyladenosine tRNA methylthiotransferase MtaB